MARQDFAYTGGVQSWIVPDQCTTIYIEATGAGSCSQIADKRQPGGTATGHLAVTPGETLYINVGGAGSPPQSPSIGRRGGFGGGGLGGLGTNWTGGSGSGASDVRQGGSALANRKIVAGGAGGFRAVTSTTSASGGRGGDTTGEQGSGGTALGSGLGGSQVAGGISGTRGTAGALGSGGGSPVVPVTDGDASGPGGGGGGYYGGGSGFPSSTGQAGGGGSNYIGGVTSGTSLRNAGPEVGAAHTKPAVNGSVSFTYNLAPNKPTVPALLPYYRVDTELPLYFVFSDFDPADSISRADVRWRPVSTSTWTTLNNVVYGGVDGAQTFIYLFASSFAAGHEGSQVEIQVRTYDALSAVGPWSSSVFTTPMTAIVDAQIIVPAEINSQTPVFQLKRSGGGQFFEVKIQCWSDSGGSPGALLEEIDFSPGSAQTLLNFTWDTGNDNYTVAVPGFQFNSETTYHFLASLSSPANVFSNYVDSGPVDVIINTPEAASVVATALPTNSPPAIQLDITNPSSGDPFPATYNDIYRTDLSTGERLRIVTSLAPSTLYIDFLPGLSTSYQYDVVPVYVAP